MHTKPPAIVLTWPNKQMPAHPTVPPTVQHIGTFPHPPAAQTQHTYADPTQHIDTAPTEPTNALYHGDNLLVLQVLQQTHAQKIDLIYLDPPFATGRIFRTRRNQHIDPPTTAYRDIWSDMGQFLSMLYPRLWHIAELLTKNGVLVVHTDSRFSSYLATILLEIFGENALQNEIIWSYGGRGAKAHANQFPRNHDTLLVFSKGKPTYHRQYQTLRHPKHQLPKHILFEEDGRPFKTSPRGDYTDQSIAHLDSQGRIHRTRNDQIRIKYFLEHDERHVIEQKQIGDVWDDIPDMMHSPRTERSGYPTQKPLALLERILRAWSNEGDTVADLFCGSGTTLLAAERLQRRWIGADQSDVAIKTTQSRLLQNPHISPFSLSRVTDPLQPDREIT